MAFDAAKVIKTGPNVLEIRPSAAAKVYDFSVLAFALSFFYFYGGILSPPGTPPEAVLGNAFGALQRKLVAREWVAAWPLVLPLLVAISALVFWGNRRLIRLDRAVGKATFSRFFFLLAWQRRSLPLEEAERLVLITLRRRCPLYRLFLEDEGMRRLFLLEETRREVIRDKVRVLQEFTRLPLLQR